MRRVIFFVFVVLSVLAFPPFIGFLCGLWLFGHTNGAADHLLMTDVVNFIAGFEAVLLVVPFMVVGYCVFLDLVCWVVMVVSRRVGAGEWEKGFRYSLIYSVVLSFFAVIMTGWSVVLRMLAF